ncbi:retrotransposon protein, putative, ty1-copia subclass [Tanacetum coccineum]
MFSPVADIRAIRILISIAAFYDYEIWQMDVKTAFLNGYLDEDIYIVQPKGFIDPKHPKKVCKHQRSIYGLKMDNSKRSYIPMKERLNLNKTQGASTPEEVKRMQNVPYTSAVGSIIEPHWTAVKTILKYLRNTKDMFLVYSGNPEAELRVDCYCDAGFETDKDDTKSQTGYLSLDHFENKSRRMMPFTNDMSSCPAKRYMRQKSPQGLHKKIFINEITVLQLKALIKVFGDLHGQFTDLMRLFDEYGFPSSAGDITVRMMEFRHGSGRSIHSVEQIEKIERPINMDVGSIVLMDLLWSDPTENDSAEVLGSEC